MGAVFAPTLHCSGSSSKRKGRHRIDQTDSHQSSCFVTECVVSVSSQNPCTVVSESESRYQSHLEEVKLTMNAQTFPKTNDVHLRVEQTFRLFVDQHIVIARARTGYFHDFRGFIIS